MCFKSTDKISKFQSFINSDLGEKSEMHAPVCFRTSGVQLIGATARCQSVGGQSHTSIATFHSKLENMMLFAELQNQSAIKEARG